jgi:hypothetical protein
MKTNDCFHFYTRLHQTELLGKKARNLVELLRGLKGIPDSSIYHHTHRFIQQHHCMLPQPPNDFAYWIKRLLNDPEYANGLGVNGKVHIKNHFLITRHLRDYLMLFLSLYHGDDIVRCLLWKPRALHGVAKGNIALSCFLCLTAFGRKNKATRFTGGSLLVRCWW